MASTFLKTAVLFAWCFTLHAQKADVYAGSVDRLPTSVAVALKKQPDAKSRVRHLLEQVEMYQYRHPEQAIVMARMARQLAQKAGSMKALEADAHFWLAWLEFQNSSATPEKALSNIKIAINQHQQASLAERLARDYSVQAALLTGINMPLARQSLEKAIEMTKEIKNHLKDSAWVMGYAYGIGASIGYMPHDSSTVSELLRKSLVMFRIAKDSIREGRTFSKLAGLYSQNGQLDSADFYLQKAVGMFRQFGFYTAEVDARRSLLQVWNQQFQQDGEEAVFEKIRREFKALTTDENSYRDCDAHCLMGLAWHQKAYKQELRAGKKGSQVYVDSANTRYYEALRLAGEEGNTECLNLATSYIAMLCEGFGNCDSALLKTAETYAHVLQTNRMVADTARRLIEQFQHREAFETDRRNREQLLNLSVGSMLLLLFATGGAYFLFQRQRIKNLHSELETRMEALRAQMNPHFISNTLNAIDSLVNHGRNQEASHYIIQFSRLCRIILNNSRSPTISLREEVDMLRYFFSLEQLRLGENLLFGIEIDPSLPLDDIRIPPMLVQPFVENAIWHGIQPKQAPGHVQVFFNRKNEKTCECIVEDDGIGREKSKELKSRTVLNQPSWGLTITEERLETIQKINGSNLRIEDLHTDSGLPAGTRVVITLSI